MSSDRTAIDRLRGLLDECGVHHVGNGGMVRFIGKDGCVCRAYTRQNPLSVDVVMTDASPEQAVATTLGQQIVRCKYCKYASIDQSDHDWRELLRCGFHRMDVKYDGFCAWGEYKEMD